MLHELKSSSFWTIFRHSVLRGHFLPDWLRLTHCAIKIYGAYNQVYIEPPPRGFGGGALYKNLTVNNLHYLIARRVKITIFTCSGCILK